jgi:hypothetical protein
MIKSHVISIQPVAYVIQIIAISLPIFTDNFTWVLVGAALLGHHSLVLLA